MSDCSPIQTLVARTIRDTSSYINITGDRIANWIDPRIDTETDAVGSPPAYERYQSNDSIFSHIKQFISASPLICLVLSTIFLGFYKTIILALVAYSLFYGVK